MSSLERLGRDVARELDRTPPPDGERERARAGFLAETARPARSRWARAAGVGAAAAAAACVALWVGARAPSATFDVGGTQPHAGAVASWMEALDSELPLRFSDGSTVLFARGARGRVESLTASGSTLLLERGRAVVSVRHRAGTRWSVSAGPFQVAVTGTRFSVEWDPRALSFTLVMEDGSVLVSGPPPYESVSLVAGQTFRAVLERPATLAPTNDAPSAATTVPEPAGRVSAEPAPSGAPSTASGAARPGVEEPGWRELGRRGEYPRAIQAVDREGSATVIAGASAPDLLLLGDVARFSGRPQLAREAYLAARARAPGTTAAAQAAFALGRLGDGALGWFQRYLAEAPDGPLSREALGRVLELQHGAKSSEAAATARRYLATFPAGPHAALARSVVARAEEAPGAAPSSSAP